MPIYEYRCLMCGHTFDERLNRVQNILACPECLNVAVRVFSAPAIHYKGFGFYCTDTHLDTIQSNIQDYEE